MEPFEVPHEFRQLPHNLQAGLVAYINEGTETGGFLRAVLENDLMSAIARADAHSLAWFVPLCQCILHHAPDGCYGSKEKVEKWLEGARLRNELQRTVERMSAQRSTGGQQ